MEFHPPPPLQVQVFQNLVPHFGAQATSLEKVLRTLCAKIETLESYIEAMSTGVTEMDQRLRTIAHNIEGTNASLDSDEGSAVHLPLPRQLSLRESAVVTNIYKEFGVAHEPMKTAKRHHHHRHSKAATGERKSEPLVAYSHPVVEEGSQPLATTGQIAAPKLAPPPSIATTPSIEGAITATAPQTPPMVTPAVLTPAATPPLVQALTQPLELTPLQATTAAVAPVATHVEAPAIPQGTTALAPLTPTGNATPVISGEITPHIETTQTNAKPLLAAMPTPALLPQAHPVETAIEKPLASEHTESAASISEALFVAPPPELPLQRYHSEPPVLVAATAAFEPVLLRNQPMPKPVHDTSAPTPALKATRSATVLVAPPVVAITKPLADANAVDPPAIATPQEQLTKRASMRHTSAKKLVSVAPRLVAQPTIGLAECADSGSDSYSDDDVEVVTSVESRALSHTPPTSPARFPTNKAITTKVTAANVVDKLSPEATAQRKALGQAAWDKLRRKKFLLTKIKGNILTAKKKDVFTVARRMELLEKHSKELFQSSKQINGDLRKAIADLTAIMHAELATKAEINAVLFLSQLQKDSERAHRALEEEVAKLKVTKADIASVEANEKKTQAAIEKLTRDLEGYARKLAANTAKVDGELAASDARAIAAKKDVDAQLHAISAQIKTNTSRIDDHRRTLKRKADLRVVHELEENILHTKAKKDDLCVARCLACHKEVTDPPAPDSGDDNDDDGDPLLKKITPSAHSQKVYKSIIPLHAALQRPEMTESPRDKAPPSPAPFRQLNLVAEKKLIKSRPGTAPIRAKPQRKTEP
ncbi:hypothetical protein ACHHYP_01570 [Achlya hypogyna]|uniref:Uncharacterized protein n=1 Tax=Achlya hypogyna TaxID=1202772 RepID=A0A1V9Z8U5_ACHHY|nr:hypothetical protein ACHHYP_01570 [Achlya hypogyna]